MHDYIDPTTAMVLSAILVFLFMRLRAIQNDRRVLTITPVITDAHVCPECAAGKCRNCDGDAWCSKRDAITECEHDCRLPKQRAALKPTTEYATTPIRPEACAEAGHLGCELVLEDGEWWTVHHPHPKSEGSQS